MDLFAPVAHEHMVNGYVDLNATTITAIRVGTTNLRDRKWLQIMNASNTRIYYGSETAPNVEITAEALAKRGQKMPQGDMVWLPVNENITVYGLSYQGGGKRLRIVEYA